ncbi:hypothetical protein OG599_11735 [Streptomyces sp. NBC_01335]|uniref:hypothetical protein n=1 Tax=Streptomyces sp. NBC_01335 TaxID=2903828 RepID=UPI002E11DC01|nr:hypothetical protein OG599_11735 [Streptomyces sp. NBC_01335]
MPGKRATTPFDGPDRVRARGQKLRALTSLTVVLLVQPVASYLGSGEFWLDERSVQVAVYVLYAGLVISLGWRVLAASHIAFDDTSAVLTNAFTRRRVPLDRIDRFERHSGLLSMTLRGRTGAMATVSSGSTQEDVDRYNDMLRRGAFAAAEEPGIPDQHFYVIPSDLALPVSVGVAALILFGG